MRVRPVSTALTVTFAPGTMAPLVSRVVPTIVPLETCALKLRGVYSRSRNARMKTSNSVGFFICSPLLVLLEIPLLSQEGWLREQENAAKPPYEKRRRGGSETEPPRLRWRSAPLLT